MKATSIILLTVSLIVAGVVVLVHAQEPGARTLRLAEPRPAVRFAAVDVFVDSGAVPLAAYQFELKARGGAFKIVGVEGGEHAAFRQPPYYDPAALMHDRVVIAAFNTGRDLPTGKTRVARIHVEIIGNETPVYDVQLVVAGGADGDSVSATASWSMAQAAERD